MLQPVLPENAAAHADALDRAADALLRRIEHFEQALEVATPTPPPKGKPGAPGYPREIRDYAVQLRRDHPTMTARAIRKRSLEKFPGREDDMPDVENFRHWLRKAAKNRAD